ncbi:hypothetical protein C8R43DRAFT_1190444 [Mycena crocata]|nr:hypothetical protein C8R43DRAFT_1190444 [Mycena crocata]
MRAAFILVAITACVLAAPSKSSLLARQIQCAAVDNDGSVLTSASASGASTVCTYAGAGACTYAADGILSGGDNSCPLGASATGATSATPTSADDNPHVPGTSTRSDDHPHSGTEDHRHGMQAGIDDHLTPGPTTPTRVRMINLKRVPMTIHTLGPMITHTLGRTTTRTLRSMVPPPALQ